MTRVVLVTGANRGIGRELGRQLALRGDAVVLTARELAKAEQAAAALPGHGHLLARRLDVTDPASVQQVAADLQVIREGLEVNLLGAWQTSLR
jgi:NAD(P)-dependent dehydrogenase (short-subunit alcohol dehydrogenase family)